jgi:hypothetical protein
MARTFLVVSTAVLIAACAAMPTVTKERMTLGEANISGMECRRDRPINTNVPRTICASPQAWAAFDENHRLAAQDLLAEGRKNANVGAFNRQ